MHLLGAGARIGDWVVEGTLGEGGMGAVYRCIHADDPDRVVAVKVVKPHGVDNAKKRFLREVEALRSLSHAAVVTVEGGGEVDGLLFMVMELLDGETLEDRLRAGPLSWADACHVMLGISRGLVQAHAQRIFHRDVKPANIMLLTGGGAKILDFGIAKFEDRTKLTQGGALPGTLTYIPPEAFSGDEVDPAQAEVYAVGLVLYEAITGKEAYEVDPAMPSGQRMAKIMGAKLTATAFDPGPEFPDALRELILRTTSPDLGLRLPGLLPVVERLEALVAGTEPPAFPQVRERTAPETSWNLLTPNPDLDRLVVDELPEKGGRGWLVAVGLFAVAVVLGMGSAAAAWWLQGPSTAPGDTDVVHGLFDDGRPVLERHGYAMEAVSPGNFYMGSDPDEPGRDADEKRHSVLLRRPFELGALEVSQGLFLDVMGQNPAQDEAQIDPMGGRDPCHDWGVDPTLPVHCVTWLEAVAFCNTLSEAYGYQKAYRDEGGSTVWDRAANGFRLPTEAEWEYAARAGGATQLYSGTDDHNELCGFANVSNPATKDQFFAWLRWAPFSCDDGHLALAPVKSFKPNTWGLYDMSGNVWEWVWDGYSEYGDDDTDPAGPQAWTPARVIRGGSWDEKTDNLRVANRGRMDWLERQMRLGFRIARSP